MKDALLTSVITIFCGVAIFVLGQIFLIFFIEPIHQLRAHIGKIAHLLIYHSDVFLSVAELNSSCQTQNASQDFKKAGSELLEKSHVIHCYWLWSILRIIPKKDNIFYAHRELIGLSHSVLNSNPENNTKRLELIKQYLKLHPKLLT